MLIVLTFGHNSNNATTNNNGRHSQEFFQEENVSLWTEISDFKTGEYAAPYKGTALEVREVSTLYRNGEDASMGVKGK